jgi:hypothetical protein
MTKRIKCRQSFKPKISEWKLAEKAVKQSHYRPGVAQRVPGS